MHNLNKNNMVKYCDECEKRIHDDEPCGIGYDQTFQEYEYYCEHCSDSSTIRYVEMNR